MSESATNLLTLTKQQRIERATKVDDQTKHPCLVEHKLSLKCLNDNKFDKEYCNKYFHNYRNCMEFWNGIETARRRKGIRPTLPPPNEREAVKKEFLAHQHSKL